MKFAQDIHIQFIRYYEEEQAVKQSLATNHEIDKPHFGMKQEQFESRLASYRWIGFYPYDAPNDTTPIVRPSDAELHDALTVMKEHAEKLKTTAKQHRRVMVQEELVNTAQSRIDCATYYLERLVSGELNESPGLPVSVQ